MMIRRVGTRMPVCAVLVALIASMVTGCAIQPTAVAISTPAPLPTYTVYPTYTPLPTYTPFPTYTPVPTVVLPTATPSPTPTPTPITYTVKVGDTATLIARRFGVTLDALLSTNSITNPNVVELGQQLIIPISVTGTLTGTLPVSVTVTVTRTFVYRTPTATAWPTPSEASSADPHSCDTGALLILHTFWNGVPEPGVRFDYHSQPYNPNNDPAKFRFSTNEKGTSYFCMPPHTRLYFFFDRDMGFDARLELGEVAEKTFDVPRLDLTLSSPLGDSYKPDSPVTFTWKPYPNAASYALTVYGEQDNFWGGTPTVIAYQARAEKNQAQLTASFSPDPVKGIYLGRPLAWTITAYNARGTVIAKSKPASFALAP